MDPLHRAIFKRGEMRSRAVVSTTYPRPPSHSATIALATREAIDAGMLAKGDLVVFGAAGAGCTAGASLWRWAY